MSPVSISYCTKIDKKLQVAVNGAEQVLTGLNSGNWNKPATVTVNVTLKPGYNEVSMGCDYAWGPDIDKFELKKK